MKSLVKASKLGFIQDDSNVDSEGNEQFEIAYDLETVTLHSKEYPKYLPNPIFLEEKDLLYKSYYAPEYDNFKQLFKAHSTTDDFYMHLPSNKIEPVIPPSKAISVEVDVPRNNAFSADYQDEVQEFCERIQGGLALLKGNALQTLQSQINQLQTLIEECTVSPTIANVNSLRELHAELLQKYAYLLD